MRYTGESCPYCKVEFTEQDDVVVCPDCGTPHHRVCWFAHGECAAADKHGEGYVWQKSAEPEQPQETKSEEKTHTHNESNLDIICPDCGESCPNGSLRCPKCGAMFITFVNPTGAPPVAQFKPGFDSDENIKGLKSGDIALFCRTAGASYIKKFRKKCSWNWAAFLFSPYWFFYRKLYKAGALFFAAFISLNLLLIPANSFVNNRSSAFVADCEKYATEQLGESEQSSTESYLAKTELYGEFAMNNRTRFVNEMLKPMLLVYGLMFLMLVLKVAAALVADRLYFKKACAEIRRVRSISSDERTVQLELFRKGGTNIFFGTGSYLISDLLILAASNFMTR